jgi:uncharacterized protein (TIGR02302 family)
MLTRLWQLIRGSARPVIRAAEAVASPPSPWLIVPTHLQHRTDADERRPAGPASGLLLAARLTVAWERLWPLLWPLVGLCGIWLSLAFLKLPQSLPAGLHLLLLLVFTALFGATAWRGWRRWQMPGRREARRRLERDSGLMHRPLQMLQDGPATAARDPFAAALWQAAQDRARQQLAGLTLHPPHPNLAFHDPFALRAAVGLVLVIAATIGWGELGPRFAASLRPDLLGGASTTAGLELWITPPDYTGLPPIFLTRDSLTAASDANEPAIPATVAVPVGSVVLARVSGGRRLPTLTANGENPVEFDRLPAGGWQLEISLVAGKELSVRQGGTVLGQWPVAIIPDQLPGIAFRKEPQSTERHSTRIDFTAADDYGLSAAQMVLTLATGNAPGSVAGNAAGSEAALDRTPVRLPLPLPGPAVRQVNGSAFHDLTPHPWAGLPVLIRLEAIDGAGQGSSSAEQPFIMPERPFAHPVARALVAERRNLLRLGSAARATAARTVAELSARPGAFGDDLSVFLNLRAVAGRLSMDFSQAALADVAQILWNSALRIEDGGLSNAERDLREARQAVLEAMEKGAPDAELDALMQQLQEKMQRYFDALEQQARQAMEQGLPPPPVPLDESQRVLDRDDLERMVQEMRDLARTGSKDAAREMLSQLQQMMENLQTGESAPDPQAMENARRMDEALQQLQELTRQQQALMDRTFRDTQTQSEPRGEEPDQQQGLSADPSARPFPGPGPGAGQGPRRQGPRPPAASDPPGEQAQNAVPPAEAGADGPVGGDNQAERQQALRRSLGDVMRKLGETGAEIPRPLGLAERAMREAEQALTDNTPRPALEAQGRALQQLQQTLQDLAQQREQAQAAGRRGMMAGQRPQLGRLPGRDPLGREPAGRGRENDGQGESETVKIPDAADVQRAREILDELRRRAGDRNRPRIERDYIDRLLERF